MILATEGPPDSSNKRENFSYKDEWVYIEAFKRPVSQCFWLKTTLHNFLNNLVTMALEYKALKIMHCYAFLSDESLLMRLPCDIIVYF